MQQAILDSPEFQKFADAARSLTAEWFGAHREALSSINAETKPNDLIATIGDDLLARFKPVPLLDEYDVYEQLMTYWHETMHDDVFLVMSDGWLEASRPREARVIGTDKNGKAKYEEAHITTGSRASIKRYVMDLVPPQLIVSRYLPDEQAKVDELAAEADAATQALEEFIVEHAVEGGLIWDAVDDSEKVTRSR